MSCSSKLTGLSGAALHTNQISRAVICQPRATQFRSIYHNSVRGQGPLVTATTRAPISTTALPVGRASTSPNLPKQNRYYTSKVPPRMRAILIKDGKGPAENMYLGEEATPEPEKGQVQVKTFGLNRMDLLQRNGQYPLPPQASKTIMGVEFAGTVTKTGAGASKYKEGDEVFGLAFGGAYAEYICSPESMLLHKPKELSFVEAAALPENWMTAYQALFVEGGMKKGSKVLIHAVRNITIYNLFSYECKTVRADGQGASGVGVAAIQLALQVGEAAQVFTTCGTDAKVKFLQDLGGNSDKLHVINYKTQNFEEEIKKVTDGVDFCIDFIGKDYFAKNLNVLNRDGVMIYLAMMSGPKLAADTNILPILFKRLTIKGSTLRSRTVDYQGDLLKRFEEHALGLIRKKKMKVEVHEVFPWTKVTEAHKEMEANKNSGKEFERLTDMPQIVFEVTD